MLDALFDVLLPARCAGCGIFADALCAECEAAIDRMPPVVRFDVAGIICVTALGSYERVLRESVLSLKYANNRVVARKLGAALARKLTFGADVIVPVPLHTTRLRARGYNQAELIARALGFPALVCAQALQRVHATDAQSALAFEARASNVRGAFSPGVSADAVRHARVLLVDDVVTTGATLRECARALHAAGASSVSGACIAAKR